MGALLLVTLTMGSVRLSARQVVLSLLGVMDNDAVDFVVRDLQWPQAKSAIATGLALGLAGTLFQQLLRNPLASPDFVGISSGASAAAVAGIVIYDFGGLGIPALAVIGALVSSVLMYVLAWRDGINGYRFILIGIGVSTFLYGLVGYLLTHSRLEEAREAMHWLTGSVGQAGNTEVNLLLVALAVLVPLSLVLRRLLRVARARRRHRPGPGHPRGGRPAGADRRRRGAHRARDRRGRAAHLRRAGGRPDRRPAARPRRRRAARGGRRRRGTGARVRLRRGQPAADPAAHRGGHRRGRGAVPAVAPGHDQQREHVDDRSSVCA